jgi:cysteine desulfurase/selenocysteine lyase
MATTRTQPIHRAEFPALRQRVNGHPLAYLDNAATTQKPERVLEAMDRYYRLDNANVHRGVHTLSQRATDAFESARHKVAAFVNAAEDAEIVFTKGCTEAINLVAASWGRANLRAGDVVLVSQMEHHANIVPWQLAAEQSGARVEPIPVTPECELDMDALRRLLRNPVRLVAVKHVCNATGTVNPVAEVAKLARAAGALLLVDGAQALAHAPVDVRAVGADFYAMSGHKVYGPTGIGALYARRALLEAMPPYQGGGDMIREVRFEGTTFNDPPNRFEAGTPNMAGAVGFGEAVDFVREAGWSAIQAHEAHLLAYLEQALADVPGLTIHGRARQKAGIVSFTLDGAHPHDIGTILDQSGVAVRTGHHCCQPLMRHLGAPATTRASLAMYNDESDADALRAGLTLVRSVLERS